MPTTFVDLSKDPAEEIEVYSLPEISYKVPSDEGSYHMHSMLRNWFDDPSMDTPKPAFVVKDQPYWKPEQVADWIKLYEHEKAHEDERRMARLKNETVGKLDIVNKLIEQAKYVQRRNLGCYSHNRGNSISDGRQRVLELQAQLEFTDKLLGEASMTKEQRTEVRDLIRKAKSSVSMD